MANEIGYDRVMQIATGFWASKVLLTAVGLGVFGILAEAPLELSELRGRLSLHPRAARDFFDALVALGLLDRDDRGHYSNSKEGEAFLNPASPTYIGGIIEMFEARLYTFWGSLAEALRTGEPQNEAKHGGDLFDALISDEKRLFSFMQSMSGLSLPLADALVHAFPWKRVRTVIDVGTAQGCIPVRLARAHPHLSGGGLDLPPVGPIFSRYVASQGLSDRLQFIPGNFFVDALPPADVLIMSHILHDWDLPTKRMLLEKAYAALGDGGALIVCELLIDDARKMHLPGLLMSLNMLIETRAGFDFTGADCVGWMRDAGFASCRVVPLAVHHSAVIGIKRST
jgi:hypothetical protein